MTLESLVNPKKIIERPWEMLFVGFLYSTIAIFLSIWIFKAYSSMIMVLLTVMASVPFMYRVIKIEEKIDVKYKDEIKILKHHSKVIRHLMFLFLGFVLSYSLWFVVLPTSIVGPLFASQLDTISAINARIVGAAIDPGRIFFQIFLNNFKVLLFAIFFAFFYGAGAIFILTWNASVISAAIGTFIKEKIASLASVGFVTYFHAIYLGLLRYMIHGIPEIAAYFVGGLAGGIISVAVINKDIETIRFKKIMRDSINLTLIAIGLLILAALLEVFVTPLFF
jgi:uncharacterized membrane protein SpoIIM required for sporulation